MTYPPQSCVHSAASAERLFPDLSSCLLSPSPWLHRTSPPILDPSLCQPSFQCSPSAVVPCPRETPSRHQLAPGLCSSTRPRRIASLSVAPAQTSTLRDPVSFLFSYHLVCDTLEFSAVGVPGEAFFRAWTVRRQSRNLPWAPWSCWKEFVRCSSSSSSCFLTWESCSGERVSRLTARVQR